MLSSLPCSDVGRPQAPSSLSRVTSSVKAEVCSKTYLQKIKYYKNVPPVYLHDNHRSTIQHIDDVRAFISKELSLGDLVGPFDTQPFTPWLRVSPAMTRPKRDSHMRRVIIDISYPPGEGVNDGIDICDFYGKNTTYALPTIKDLITRLQECGRGP